MKTIDKIKGNYILVRPRIFTDNVNRIVAKTIWDAGVDCFTAHLQKLFPNG